MSYALQPSPTDKKYLLLKQKENQEKGHTSILRGRDVKVFSSLHHPGTSYQCPICLSQVIDSFELNTLWMVHGCQNISLTFCFSHLNVVLEAYLRHVI